MLVQERWAPWEPTGGLARHYEIDYIEHAEDFHVILSAMNGKEKMKFQFLSGLDIYRQYYGIFRDNVVAHIEGQQGKGFCEEWTFFKVEHSSYVAWILGQTYGLYDNVPWVHLAIITRDSILDIIIGEDDLPIITFL